MRGVLALAVLVSLMGCRDDAVSLPSGLDVELIETLIEPQQHSEETWVIVRMLAPSLAGQQVTAEGMAADTDAICANWGVAAARDLTTPPDQIVVQVMSEQVERGQSAPGITQIFAGYRFENDICIWENF